MPPTQLALALTADRTDAAHIERFAGTFEGEFSQTTDSYAGKGSVKYAW